MNYRLVKKTRIISPSFVSFSKTKMDICPDSIRNLASAIAEGPYVTAPNEPKSLTALLKQFAVPAQSLDVATARADALECAREVYGTLPNDTRSIVDCCLTPDRITGLLPSVCILGSPGTGKSALTTVIVTFANAYYDIKYGGSKPFIAVTASTNAAASLLGSSAITFSRLIGFIMVKDPVTGLFKPSVPMNAKTIHSFAMRTSCVRMILLDEIGMVSGTLFSFAERWFRVSRESQLPFGGVSVIGVGDLYQLPPVERFSSTTPFPLLRNEPQFVFLSDAWADVFGNNVFQLVHQYRFGDCPFLPTIVEEVKLGVLSDDTRELLRSRMVSDDDIPVDAVILCPTRERVNFYNTLHYNHLVDQMDEHERANAELLFTARMYRETEQISATNIGMVTVTTPADFGQDGMFATAQEMEDTHYVPFDLHLVRGCAVLIMCDGKGEDNIKDIYRNCPATFLGKMSRHRRAHRDRPAYDEEIAIVRLTSNGRTVELKPHAFRSRCLGGHHGWIVVKQVPLMHAQAVTVHRIQGATLPKVHIISGSFETGQAYVAISRGQSLDCITFDAFNERDFKPPHPLIQLFYAYVDANKKFDVRVDIGMRTKLD